MFGFLNNLFGKNETVQTVTQEQPVKQNPLKDLKEQVPPRIKSDPLTYQSKADFMAALATGQFNEPQETATNIMLSEGVRIGAYRSSGHASFKAHRGTAITMGRALHRMDTSNIRLLQTRMENRNGEDVRVYTLHDDSHPEGGKTYKVYYGKAMDNDGQEYTGWVTLHEVESVDANGEVRIRWAPHYSEKYTRQMAYNHNQRVQKDRFVKVWGAPTIFTFIALMESGEGVTLHCASRYAKKHAATIQAYRDNPYPRY